MNIVVVFPQSQAAKAELAHRVSQIQAEHITKMVQQLRCTSSQKQKVMDAVICQFISASKENAD